MRPLLWDVKRKRVGKSSLLGRERRPRQGLKSLATSAPSLRDAGIPADPSASAADGPPRRTSHALLTAYGQRDTLLETGADTTAIDSRILDLKRQLRQGPQLNAGEFLANGRYQLIHPLGEGGFATVWLASDRHEKTQVAVKVLHGQFSSSEERRDRLFRGAEQMAKLDHAHIVEVLAKPAVESDGWAYFVMEYLAGGDFRRAVLDGTLDREQRLDALDSIAAALDHAHGESVIHRDVKPANILLSADGVAKLTDFDLVRADDTTGLTRTRAGMGSYLFAAPESLSSAATAGPPCDIYSLAATWAFAMLDGALEPHFVFDRTAYLAQLDLPEAVRDVLANALHLDPSQRPTSAAELCGRLRTALAPPPPKPKPQPEPDAEPKRRSPRRPVADRDLFEKVVTRDGEVDLWRKIPAGEGWIGSPEGVGHADERPRHRIEVVRPFLMATVPVTNSQFAAFDAEKANVEEPDHPIVEVTWQEAMAFCRWLDAEHGLRGARLPTEEEWEYACRAGSGHRYWKGDSESDLEEIGWYMENSGGSTQPVGKKPANPWGLYDVHGNVWEWTASAWKDDYAQQAAGLTVDPAAKPEDLAAPPRAWRVIRGGSCAVTAGGARSACRYWFGPRNRWQYLGFRVLLPPPSGRS